MVDLLPSKAAEKVALAGDEIRCTKGPFQRNPLRRRNDQAHAAQRAPPPSSDGRPSCCSCTAVGMLECFITAELSRSSAPRAAL
jgi:hypothetical protein